LLQVIEGSFTQRFSAYRDDLSRVNAALSLDENCTLQRVRAKFFTGDPALLEPHAIGVDADEIYGIDSKPPSTIEDH
jgi:hypothetical protein